MPRVGGFGAVNAVELGRVADRLVHLEHHLLGVDDDRRNSEGHASAVRSAAASSDPGRLAVQAESLDELPTGLSARAAVGARVCDSAPASSETASASMPPPHSTKPA